MGTLNPWKTYRKAKGGDIRCRDCAHCRRPDPYERHRCYLTGMCVVGGNHTCEFADKRLLLAAGEAS